jgi:hypothetical protein
MTLDNFKRIIDEVKDTTNSVALGGRGDPNLHENFEDILHYAKEHNVIPNYTTSGNNLTDRQIVISKDLCGAVAVSDYKQDFTYSAIKRFQEIGMKTNIHYILKKDNMDEAFNILDGKDVWEGNINLSKVNALIFLLFKAQGRGKNRFDLIPDNEQMKTFIDKTRNNKFSGKIGLDSCSFNKFSQLSVLNNSEKLFGDTCEAARMSCYITPDMKLIPCSFMNHNMGIQLSKDISIQSVWENSKLFCDSRKQLQTTPNECPIKF